MKRILITGARGYIGNALMHALAGKDLEISSIDDGSRERWVNDVGGKSLTNYEEILSNHFFNLMDFKMVKSAIEMCKPDIICHLASQPSGPYSEIDSWHRIETQTGNIRMLLNLGLAAKELGLKPKMIVTTTTGIPGAPDTPIREAPMANLAGSAYHVSRGFDSANLHLFSRQFGFDIHELRTSIVYGTRIDGIDQPVTRFDWDFYFGTVIHRFILRKIMGLPITIYGKGLQRKPIVALRDVVKSIVNLIEDDLERGLLIYNQVGQCLSVVQMAKTISNDVEHIENPRYENEEHKMEIENGNFTTLLDRTSTELKDEIEMINHDINPAWLPKDWKNAFDGK